MIDIKRQEDAFKKLVNYGNCNLEEKFSILKNYSFSRAYEVTENTYAHIHYGDIHSYYQGIIKHDTTLKNVKIPEGDYSYIREEDIVLADASEDYNDLGKAVFIQSIATNKKLISGLHTFHLRPKHNYNAQLFYQFTKSNNYKNQMLKLGTGTSVFGITKSNLEKIQIYNFRRSDEIANFLTALDELIQKQEDYIRKLKVQKKGYSNKLIVNNGDSVRLNEIIEYVNYDKVSDTGKYNKITVGLHKKGLKRLSDISKRSDTRPFYLRKTNEIILGKQNYFNGSIAIISEEFNNTIASNAILSFKINDNNSTKYVYELLSNNNFRAKRAALANGTGQKELSEGEFFNFEVKLPSIEEQKMIAKFLTILDKRIELQDQKLEQLKVKKKYYLNKIFR